MKKIVALVLALFVVSAHSAGDDLIFQQRNSADTTSIPRIPAHPLSDGLLWYDFATLLPKWVSLGTNLSITGGVINAASSSQINSDWTASSGVAQILNKPAFATLAFTGQYADLVGVPGTFAPSAHTHPQSDVIGLTAALAAKFSAPSGTTAQYVRGDGSLATLPVAATFNYGAINTRTFSASTAYQATDSTKAAIVKASPSCTASLSLTAGGTCTIQARVGSPGLTCSTGTVVATWTNANTGTLTVGLGLNQTVGSPGNIELAIGEAFILCPTAGTFTIANGIDRSQG